MMPFSAAQNNALAAPLERERIAHRSESGRQLSYLEGWDVMDKANTIFGFDGWGYRVTRLEFAAGVWLATVLTTVNAGGEPLVREDVGVGIPAKPREVAEASPAAQETAIKGAVTDALKRALRGYGDAFGLSLYDKDGDDVKPQPAKPPARPVVVTVPQAPVKAQPATLTKERADKLAGLIRAQLTSQGVDDVYARTWIKAKLRRAGCEFLTELTEQAGAALLAQAAQADVTQPADGSAR
ncbi:MAG: Rad52/Rad22 family DNA repair protein [Acidiferrobacterales bacterium]